MAVGDVGAQLDARLPDLTASVRAGQLADAQGNPGRTVSGNLNVKAGTLGAQVSLPLRDTSAAPNGFALSLSASLPLLARMSRSSAMSRWSGTSIVRSPPRAVSADHSRPSRVTKRPGSL